MDLFQVAQHAEDLERAKTFYSRLLDSEAAAFFDPPGLLFFSVSGIRLLLDREAPTSLIYFRVPNVAEAIARCRADGIEIRSEPHVIFTHSDDRLGPAGTEESMAFIRDSEGNTIGLVSHAPAAR
jgi:methylmalonyl-CoA/ethylmalonyl-CoA epimerase